jgi:pilus assembly protein Flp/PilA
MLNFLQSYMITRTKSEKGASAVEYGLLVAGIAALIVVIVFALGGVIEGAFKTTCDEVSQRTATC